MEVVERVKKRVKLEADQQVNQLEQVEKSDVLEELNALFQQGVDLIEPTDLTGSIRGRVNIHNHLEHAIKNAQKEVLLVTSAKGLGRKHEALRKALKKASERGVDVKIAAPLSPENEALVEDIKKFGSFRAVDHINGRFMLVDGEQVTFMLLEGDKVHPSYDTAVWAKTPYFATTMKDMFHHASKKKE